MTLRLALVAMAILAGCSAGAPSPPPTPATHEVKGTLHLDSTDSTISGGPCHGTGGYDDIKDGTQLLLKDGAGATLATGNLTGGERAKVGCTYSFTFSPAVPEVPFYTIVIGKRGGPTYSTNDLAAETWSVVLTLGDGT